jgi:hypothetical protein
MKKYWYFFLFTFASIFFIILYLPLIFHKRSYDLDVNAFSSSEITLAKKNLQLAIFIMITIFISIKYTPIPLHLFQRI